MTNNILIIIRTLFYLWIAVECIITFYVYYYGYVLLKHTPVIRALTFTILSVAIYFFYLSFLTFSIFFDPEFRDLMLKIVPIIIFPLGYYCHKFRDYSNAAEIELQEKEDSQEVIIKNRKEVDNT